jgi:hypothetical protein
MMPMIIVPSGKSSKESQKNANLLRPLRSAALPIAKLATIAIARKTKNTIIGAAVNAARSFPMDPPGSSVTQAYETDG